MKTAKFPLGRVVATSHALSTLSASDMAQALARHLSGDWGDVCEEDRKANECALENGERLLSVYHNEKKTKFYVITEWDRSYTTILLPERLLNGIKLSFVERLHFSPSTALTAPPIG